MADGFQFAFQDKEDMPHRVALTEQYRPLVQRDGFCLREKFGQKQWRRW